MAVGADDVDDASSVVAIDATEGEASAPPGPLVNSGEDTAMAGLFSTSPTGRPPIRLTVLRGFGKLWSDLSDESSDFQQTCSPAAYTAFSGDLAPLRCCSTCENEVLDCFDYRLYIDASGPSNVSAPLSLRLSLFSLAQYTRFMVRVQVSVYR